MIDCMTCLHNPLSQLKRKSVKIKLDGPPRIIDLKESPIWSPQVSYWTLALQGSSKNVLFYDIVKKGCNPSKGLELVMSDE